MPSGLANGSLHFNPRSLTGATVVRPVLLTACVISIHAPLRERQNRLDLSLTGRSNFNPRSLTGATAAASRLIYMWTISIHAPLRERPQKVLQLFRHRRFQSTLPYGSDINSASPAISSPYFNPRSLTGATLIN